MARGEKVKVRRFDGTVGSVVVWDEAKDVVFVTSSENYKQLLKGIYEALPIGFPKRDIVSTGKPTGNTSKRK